MRLILLGLGARGRHDWPVNYPGFEAEKNRCRRGDVLVGAVLYYGRPLAFEAVKRLKDVLGTPCVKADVHSFRNFSSLQSGLREQAKVLIRIDIRNAARSVLPSMNYLWYIVLNKVHREG